MDWGEYGADTTKKRHNPCRSPDYCLPLDRMSTECSVLTAIGDLSGRAPRWNKAADVRWHDLYSASTGPKSDQLVLRV